MRYLRRQFSWNRFAIAGAGIGFFAIVATIVVISTGLLRLPQSALLVVSGVATLGVLLLGRIGAADGSERVAAPSDQR